MSVKEEKFVILEDKVSSRFLIAEVTENGLLVSDSKNPGSLKNGMPIQIDKSLEGNIKKEVTLNEIQEPNVLQHSVICAVCQNICNNCKSICVTCKCPYRHFKPMCKNSSTDTDDFVKYLESQTKKVKLPVRVKTIGTDTCDLEGHFDYYNSDKKCGKIQKHVATDCIDLNVKKVVNKKPVKNSVAVDTSDLQLTLIQSDANDESDCEFFWNNKEEPKTYSKKPITEKTSQKNEEKHCDDDISENSLVIDEDASYFPSVREENKDLFVGITSRIITFDETASEDSDIDLVTSCTVSKCQKIARDYKITLREITQDKNISYKCSICGDMFDKKYKGVLHLGNHVENNLFKCLTCDEKLQTLDLLCLHIKKKHDLMTDIKSGIENKENSEIDFPKTKLNKTYNCLLCPESNEAVKFDSYKKLNLHKKEIHGVEIKKVCNSKKVEKKPRIKQEFICLICGKQFKSSKSLKDHSPVHTGEKNYQCDICKKSYTTSANLKIHKRTHTGAKNFVCTVCGKAFHKKDSLKVHFRKHSGERPFECDLCPMKFDRNYVLKNHRYTHFSEKKFICPICGKTFTTHGGLNNHEKGHKKDPFAKKPRKPPVKPTLGAENAVICDICGKIYSTRSNLRIHKFIHMGVKPFECTICHQTYAKKDSMLTHMRKHTDERPFSCETCGMSFYRNHTLKTHLLRHTGERPHKCKMCGKSFTQSSSLSYHLKNHDRKLEKKKVMDDPTVVKKKRLSQGNKIGRVKKIQKIIKPLPEIEVEDIKPKPVDGSTDTTILKNSVPVHDKDVSKATHFPVPEKEILIMDKSLDMELPRNVNPAKESDIYGMDKEIAFGNSCNTSKFNYYIAKSHVFSIPKEEIRVKKEAEVDIDKNQEDVGNLIISKNSYITKEGNLVTLNQNSSLKDVKEFMQIGDERLDLKPQMAIPVTGEILNAAFITDENGDVIPLSSMTLQGLSENVMISPLISVESEDRKGFLRNSKFTVMDPKISYNLTAATRILNEKNQTKGNFHVINIKDPKTPPKVQIELGSPALQVQASVDDSALQGIPTFYNNVQQNEI